MTNNIVNTIAAYTLAKIDLTECMQKNFRQVCHNCKNYCGCETYNNYVEAWMNLQKSFMKGTENEN